MDGQPDFEMVDEHPTRQELEEDLMEFDSDMVVHTAAVGEHHGVKHAQSKRTEEMKVDLRTKGFFRSNTGVAQQIPGTKLEAKRREKRLQEHAARRGYNDNNQF